MTVILAIRLPGEGAILAGDGRVTVGSEILTDSCEKLAVFGSIALGVSGHDGGLLQALEPAKNLAEVMKLANDYTRGSSLAWDAVAYDRKQDQLLYLDYHGAVITAPGIFATTGSGGTYAMGFVEARPRPKTFEEATELAKQTLRTTFKKNSECGGRIRLLTVKGRRGAVVIS